jgi:hypothetical protein
MRRKFCNGKRGSIFFLLSHSLCNWAPLLILLTPSVYPVFHRITQPETEPYTAVVEASSMKPTVRLKKTAIMQVWYSRRTLNNAICSSQYTPSKFQQNFGKE